MPRRSRSPCAEPGCPNLSTKTRCDEHQREQYRIDRQQRGSTTQRGLGADHQRLAAQTITRQPWCTICGDTQAEVEARGDKLTGGHIIDRAAGGPNIASNYQTECGRCNYGKRTSGTPTDLPPPTFA